MTRGASQWRGANGLKILGIDSTARVASACICDGDRIVAETTVDAGLTHSQTLLKMVDGLFGLTGLGMQDIEACAVSHGPGSFTGVRIGIAAVKGLCFPHDTPCIGVSTLEALSYGLRGQHALVCAAMDARCSQVYTATFRVQGDTVERLTPDSALMIDELCQQLEEMPRDLPLFLVGDGSELCYNSFGERLQASLAPMHLRYQRASSVCAAALAGGSQVIPAAQLQPFYLRLPQAERERLKRMKENET